MIFLDKFLQGLKPQFDDDAVDRLNYYYTPMLLVIFALTLSAKQYVGQPIQCWIPAQFTGAWEQYSENYCFVQNTYFLPLTYYIPQSVYQREEQEIGYYQWVPFVLGLQAILFYLPSLVWRILNWQSGISVKGIMQMCEDVGNIQVDKRAASVEVVGAHIADALKMQETLGRRTIFNPLISRSRYLTLLYLVVKGLYLIQVFVQFFILNRFLGTNYTFYGFEVLRDLAYGKEWQESGHFPRVTMCDFEVRALGNIHRHTVQCVLMINMFNEKVYIFIWWWLLVVLFATLGNLAYWFVVSLTSSQQESFVNQYLRPFHLSRNKEDRKVLNNFVHKFLKPDGVFLLRLVATNAGDLITTDLINRLWHQFLQEKSSLAPTLPRTPSAPNEPKNIDDVDGDFSEDEKRRLT